MPPAARGIALRALGRAEADLADPEACARAIRAVRRRDRRQRRRLHRRRRAEDEPRHRAKRSTPHAPGAMAEAAAARGMPFLHVSTDYVFDGRAPAAPGARTTRPARSAPTAPRKLAGERAVVAADPGPRHPAHRLGLLRARPELREDHARRRPRPPRDARRRRPARRPDRRRATSPPRSGPSPTAWTAGRGVPGVFHYAGAPGDQLGRLRRGDLRRAPAGRSGPRVTAIATADWPTRALRPAYSVLDCTAIAARLRHRPARLAPGARRGRRRARGGEGVSGARASSWPAAPAPGSTRSPTRCRSSCCRSTTSR